MCDVIDWLIDWWVDGRMDGWWKWGYKRKKKILSGKRLNAALFARVTLKKVNPILKLNDWSIIKWSGVIEGLNTSCYYLYSLTQRKKISGQSWFIREKKKKSMNRRINESTNVNDDGSEGKVKSRWRTNYSTMRKCNTLLSLTYSLLIYLLTHLPRHLLTHSLLITYKSRVTSHESLPSIQKKRPKV